MKLLIDSYAWIEYLNGGSVGQKVRELLLENNEVYTLNLMIAEVISRVEREGGNSGLAYEAIISNSKIINIIPKLAKEAGLFHAKIRKKIKNFGLMDSLIFVMAKEMGAKIVTGDEPFKGFKETVFLG